jgi:hypothetical protein
MCARWLIRWQPAAQGWSALPSTATEKLTAPDVGGVHSIDRAPGLYFCIWALVLPVTSVLLVPSIQGTTLAYIMALLLLMPWVNVLVLGGSLTNRFYGELAFIGALFVGLTVASQLVLAIYDPLDPVLFGRVPLLDSEDDALLLRTSLFTQSIYFLAAICTFLFVKLRYTPAWDHWLLAGAVLLGLYGLYEVIFFLLMGSNGDFLTNRTFGAARDSPGSLFQTMQLGPIEMPRLKSLTGEPSMYAFTILPFWIYALHTRRHWVQLFLLATLLLSTSTTAFVGMAVYLVVRFVFSRGRDPLSIAAIVLFVLGVAALWLFGNEFVEKVFNALIGNKIAARDASGSERLGNTTAVMNLYESLPLASQLFGVGFGYVRSTDFVSTLLVNTGVIGLLAFSALYLYPVFKLGRTEREIGLRAALLVIFVTAMISVPEFAYLSSWLFLGIAYHQLHWVRASAARMRPAHGSPVQRATTVHAGELK